MELNNILFQFPKGNKNILGKTPLGAMGPTGLYLSLKRPSSSICRKAKISNAAYMIEFLTKGKLNAIQINDMVYVEFEGEDKQRYQATCNGSNICVSSTDFPSHYYSIPLTLYLMILEEGKNTKSSIEKMYQNTTIEESDLFEFCDNVYYESKAAFPDNITCNSLLSLESVRQSIRTENYMELFEGDIKKYADLYPMTVFEGLHISPETASDPEDDDKMQDCRIGSYFLNHVWDIERQSYIPDLSTLEDFVPNEAFYTMVDLIHYSLSNVEERMDKGKLSVDAIGEDYVNCQFVGRPGTGKTTIADALGAAFNMPVRVVVNSKNTEEDTMQGMTKVQEGGFKFVETPFLDVYKNGGILLLEEFNLADPGVMMGALGQAIEKPFILLEDGYREVRRHPLCVVIATMNTGTQGSRSPSEALTSRMPNVFLLDDPEEKQFLQILQNRSGQTRNNCKKVYNAYKKTIDYLESPSVNQEEVALSITLRHCLAALKQMTIGRKYKQALYNTIIGTIAIKDIALAKEVNNNVIQHLPD